VIGGVALTSPSLDVIHLDLRAAAASMVAPPGPDGRTQSARRRRQVAGVSPRGAPVRWGRGEQCWAGMRWPPPIRWRRLRTSVPPFV